ncbi:PPC domain-containing protein [Myxococcota bacterium]|nr:PPC domain-containing protein [Myxococcota bacterium]
MKTIRFAALTSLLAASFMLGACGDDDNDNKDDVIDDTPIATCANSALDDGEVCDGELFGTNSCTAEGFAGGELSCAVDCKSFSTDGCTMCGNNQIDGDEVCDGTAGVTQTCTGLGYLNGEVGCNATCTAEDVSLCSNCEVGFYEDEDGECVASECDADCSYLGAAHCELIAGPYGPEDDCVCNYGFVGVGDEGHCEVIPACTDDAIANDFATAAVVTLPFEQTNQLCTMQPDIYRVDMTQGEWLFVDLEWPDAGAHDLDIRIFAGPSRDDTLEAFSDSDTDFESTGFQAEAAHTYYVVIDSFEIVDTTYTVSMRRTCVSDEECGGFNLCSTTTHLCEEGGVCVDDGMPGFQSDATVAQTLPVEDQAHTICAYDSDWYKFSVSGNQMLRMDILINSDSTDLDMDLYNSGETIITVSQSDTTHEYITYTATNNEDLYLTVYGYGDEAPYALYASICGNQTVDGNEDCDGTHMDGKDCTDLGYTGGTLTCDYECFFDESACTN